MWFVITTTIAQGSSTPGNAEQARYYTVAFFTMASLLTLLVGVVAVMVLIRWVRRRVGRPTRSKLAVGSESPWEEAGHRLQMGDSPDKAGDQKK